MRVAILAVILSFLMLFSSPAQQLSSVNLQPAQILQQALAALNGPTALQDITLSGSAHYIAGSDDETGTATLKALATGASRIDLSLTAGPRSEVRNLTLTPPTGTWSGPDGVGHDIPYHNLVMEPSWFSPAAAITRELATTGYVATYIDAETLDSQSVQHISVSQQLAGLSGVVPLIPHLTQVDYYLDSSTFLPAAIAFNVHPDNDAGLDIPIQIRFSDYQPVSGAQVPLHVQKFLNNTLVLDLQLSNATINSGLSPTDFVSIQ
jgi:hypothetical protein